MYGPKVKSGSCNQGARWLKQSALNNTEAGSKISARPATSVQTDPQVLLNQKGLGRLPPSTLPLHVSCDELDVLNWGARLHHPPIEQLHSKLLSTQFLHLANY